MRMLYVVRHGIAMPYGTPGVSDDERRLTDRGRAHLAQIARRLVQLDLRIQTIVTSPLPRARETAEILHRALQGKGTLAPAFEVADTLSARHSAADIADWLTCRDEAQLMIVGHNPAFSDLVGLLTLGEPRSVTNLRRGGIAALRQESPGSGSTIDWLSRPRLFRRLRK